MAEDPHGASPPPVAPAPDAAGEAARSRPNGESHPNAGAAPPEAPPKGEPLSGGEERLLRLVLTLPTAVYAADAEGRITRFNARAAELWGRRPEIGEDLWCGSWRLFRPDGTPLPHEACPMAIALREGRRVHGEETVVERPDGTRVHVLEHPEPIRDASGEVVGAVNVLVDVSERKEAERDQALLAAIVASSDDAIISKTLDGVITSWNAGAERIFGYTAAEAVGQPVLMLIPPERREEERLILERLRRGGRVDHFETVRLAKDGRPLDVSLTISPIRDRAGRVVGASKVARDVTASKRAERALRDAEARYRAFLALSQEGIWRFDLDEPIPTIIPAEEQVERMYRHAWLAECNDAFARTYGFDRPEEVVGARLGDLVPLDDPANRAYLRAFIENGYRLAEAESREVDRDGSPRVISNTLAGEVEGRSLVRAWGTQRDVTDRIAVEEALRESEARFRQFVDAMPQIAFTLDAEGQSGVFNGRWFEYTGDDPATSSPERRRRFFHPDDLPATQAAWAQAFGDGEPFEMEYRIRRADGLYRWHLARVVPVAGADSARRWFGTATDIHAQKAAEAELEARVAERTAELERSNRELDQFAYVASHDLKAPLRGIDNLAAWIAEDAGRRLPEESRRHLDLLQGRVRRMEQLLDSLLLYSRAGRTTGLAEPVDTAALVRDVADLLDLPGPFAVEVGAALPTITTYRAPLELVFRNLIGNAAKHHDRPDGRVRVTAREGAQGDALGDSRGSPFVEFAVSDDGPGIAPKYHERIFGLFQTLRPRDEVEGSGMGLAVVRKTVESLGGAVRVESSPGAGTTLYFTWPCQV